MVLGTLIYIIIIIVVIIVIIALLKFLFQLFFVAPIGIDSAAAVAELIDNKKMFIIACEPSMTDPDTQCVVANLQMR